MQAPASRKWTADELRRLCPGARPDYIAALIEGQTLLDQAQINTPLRRCHFLAQIMHETGDLTIIREKCTWTVDQMCALWPTRFKKTDPVFRARYATARGDEESLAEMAYGASVRPDLGNTDDGDGFRFRGGGCFQGTGRGWFRETGQAIGVDLEGQPELIEDPKVSLTAAVWYWKKYNLNRFADANYIRAIGNQINRGNPYSKHEPIGAAERKRCFDRAWAVLGQGPLPSPLELSLGAHGTEVEAVQDQLRTLGYQCGAKDGVFGPELSRQLAAFKADWKRRTGQECEPDDKVGPITRSALAVSDPIRRPEREAMTLADLREAGSTEVQHGVGMQKMGLMLAAVGGSAGSAQTGQLDFLQSNLGWVPAAHTFMIPVLEGLKWFATNLLWIVPVVAGIWFWAKGRAWLTARLNAARKGLNLSR